MSRRIQLWRKPETRNQTGNWKFDTRNRPILSSQSQISNSRSPRHQRGSTLMEFALILPVFLLLTVGLIDFGRGIWAYNTLSHAAREGARYAIVRGEKSPYPTSSAQIEEQVKSRAAGLDPAKVVVTTLWDPNNEPGSVIEVRVQYDFQPMTPLLPPETITLRSISRMVISY